MSRESETSRFSELVLGFASAALTYLGELYSGDSSTEVVNLDLAKQNIDFLDVLKEKTKGNLDEQELKLLTSVLTDLKSKYSAKASSM